MVVGNVGGQEWAMLEWQEWAMLVGKNRGQGWLVRTVGKLVRVGCSGMRCAASPRVVDIITWSAHYIVRHDAQWTILLEFSGYVPINQHVVGVVIVSKCCLVC